MDAFLPRLFEPSDNSEAILGSEAWIFSCKCGKYSSSDEPSFQVDVRASDQHIHIVQGSPVTCQLCIHF